MSSRRERFAADARNAPNINYLWSRLLVEELVRCGVGHFWVAPGSRSAPLAVAINDHPGARMTVHFDERGLAFHALGFSSAAHEPVAVVCTSGTAVANLFPAIVECEKKKLPIIVLTADRPPELRHAGAHQTIDQVKIFEGHVRWQVDLPCPSETIDPAMLLTTVDQAVATARGEPGGPVHLNCMFREPLAPVSHGRMPKLRLLDKWASSGRPYTTHAPSVRVPTAPAIGDAAALIDRSRSGVIAAGKLSSEEDRRDVLELAGHLGWPLFCDLSSGLRLGKGIDNRIHYFDRIMAAGLASAFRPDCVLHVGGRMTSKHWYDFVEKARPGAYIMILNHPLRSDPFHRVSLRLRGAASGVCRAIREATQARQSGAAMTMLHECDAAAHACLESHRRRSTKLSEIATARTITRLAPARSALFCGNSLPVRLMDFFGDPTGAPLRFGANRGASGIDGTIATAAGFAAGCRVPTTVLCGDLAMLHDLNSLSLCVNTTHPLVIVVLNNGGGGIFSLLPVAAYESGFDTVFAARHGFSFADAARMFSLRYKSPGTMEGFAREYLEAIGARGTTIIEVKTERRETAREIERMTDKIGRVVAPLLGPRALKGSLRQRR